MPTTLMIAGGTNAECACCNAAALRALMDARYATRVLTSIDRPQEHAPRAAILRCHTARECRALVDALRPHWRTTALLAVFCQGSPAVADVTTLLQYGVDDYLSCPFTPLDLLPRIDRLMAARRAPAARRSLQTLLGESEAFTRVVRQIPMVAEVDAPVLLTGETGTGKELFAHAIHYSSARSGGPFLPVNCGALPDQLFENELFGHARGAFTDASASQKGLLAAAAGGTLFLDEVDSLSMSAQIKLLRLLQDGAYRPLGSIQTEIVDLRIVAATNADLRARLQAGVFREDLYHRLDVLPMRIPPLRQRRADIPLLAAHFLDRYSAEYRRPQPRLTSAALEHLLAYHWPGNVRELQSAMRRAVVHSGGADLQPADIELSFADPSPANPVGFRGAKKTVIDGFEHEYLVQLLSAWKGNVSHAARAAGKERRAFQRLLRKHALDRQQFVLQK